MRIALAVEYNGSDFCGWQRQPHSPSVQQELERALGVVADHPVTVICAGRTDTGVHALAQIVHFETAAQRPLKAWTFGVNSNLPASVSVHWAAVVSDDFHARFSAQTRSYQYRIFNRLNRPAIYSGQVTWVHRELDVLPMQQAAAALLGEHDFSSFRAAECQAHHPVRRVHRLQVQRRGDMVLIDITANGFLHNMVRIVAGSLIRIGTGEEEVAWLSSLLAARDRTLAGMTAKPDGLYFVNASYPAEFGIPEFVDPVLQSLPGQPA